MRVRASCLVVLAAVLTCGFVLAQEAPAPESEEPAKKWKSSVEFAASGSRGTTLSDSVRLAGKSAMKTELHRLTLDACYNYGTSSGSESKNDGTAGVVKDWLIPKVPWFLFADGRYDYNRFGSWDHRFSGHGGVGYDLLRQKRLDVTLRVGAGGYEALEDGLGVRYEGLLGGEVTWRIRKGQELGAKNTWYPALNADAIGKHYRVVSSAYWKLNVAHFEAMSVKFSIDHEYETQASDDGRHHDTKYCAAVMMSF